MAGKAQTIPQFRDLFNPLLDALRRLGGSATVEEIEEEVAKNLQLPAEILDQPSESHPYKSEVMYRLAWARTYLKNYGVIANSQRGVWALTAKGQQLLLVDPQEVVRAAAALAKESRRTKKLASQGPAGDSGPASEDPDDWKQVLINTIIKQMTPAGFERLIQRILRESGFIQVEVTGRSGDGGIDGKGIARIHGFMSFHVVFQAKKYSGSVVVGQIRDFRGAMVGKGDKGLFITTGVFTKDAKAEACRDGATPIDLIDGEELATKLKELALGVTTTTIEQVTVDPEWFKTV
ncbi:MAG: restriction endonuclease [Planctomycetaceae bacterium]